MVNNARKDIVVTTPKRLEAIAAQEARQCIEAGKGFYFRTFRAKPRFIDVGSRIYYVEQAYVRGFGTVSEIVSGDMQCETTGIDWGEGYHAVMPAESWYWVKPIAMQGFQGWRYFDIQRGKVKTIGNWLKPKPSIGVERKAKRKERSSCDISYFFGW